MDVVADIETNRLNNPDKIHCIVCIDIETKKEYVFRKVTDNPTDFISFVSNVDLWIGHKFLTFDRRQINRLLGTSIPSNSVIDTLVCSRVFNYSAGGHSLEDWGERFGIPKLHLDINFENYSEELVERCIQDTRINLKLYENFKPFIEDPDYKEALSIEHYIDDVCEDMHETGFNFKLNKAQKLHAQVLKELAVVESELEKAFPPRSVLIKEITPKATKHGTINKSDFRWEESGDLRPYSVGWAFSRFEWRPFKPSSSKQRIEVLNDAGWNPTDKSKAHIEFYKQYGKDEDRLLPERALYFRIYGWKTNECNLETLPAEAPEAARTLVKWLLLNARRSTLEEWFNAYDNKTRRIHGSFSHIGAWTQRFSHSRPNMGNVPSTNSKYNGAELKLIAKRYGCGMRSCWSAPASRLLVGTDAEGIQARVLAHYLNDPEFTHELLHGDIHTLNWEKLKPFCKTRANAKTFYYAWLLGAGAAKVADILGCTVHEARIAVDRFIESYPGLRYLKDEKIPQDARNGYFVGFDGRIVPCSSEYLMLGGYLQNGETVVMKHATRYWMKQVNKEGIYAKLVNFVHDEWQTETERSMELAQEVGRLQSESIRIIGESFGLNCPLAGKSTIGYNWNQTH